MYKSRFKYFGSSSLIILLGISILPLEIGLLIKFFRTGQDGRALVLVGPLLLFVTIFIWNKILTEMNEISVTNLDIKIRNPFTNSINTIEKRKIKGFKDVFRNGYTILIIDESDNVVGKIHDYYYVDFKELSDNLNLKYLERIPTFWDKIIKVDE